MEAMVALMVILAGIALVGGSAGLFGVDSREGSTDPRKPAPGIAA